MYMGAFVYDKSQKYELKQRVQLICYSCESVHNRTYTHIRAFVIFVFLRYSLCLGICFFFSIKKKEKE